MSKTEGVWVVSAGEYSDYSVLCACPSKVDAEAVAEKVRSDSDMMSRDAHVEWLPIATADVEKVAVLRMSTEIYDDGREYVGEHHVAGRWPFDELFEGEMQPVVWRWVRAPIHEHAGGGGRLEVYGTDHELVRKVYSDRRAMYLTDPAMRAKRGARGGRRTRGES